MSASSWLPLRVSFPRPSQTHKQDLCGYMNLKGVGPAAPISGVFDKPCSRGFLPSVEKICAGNEGRPTQRPAPRAAQMKELPLWTLLGNPDSLLIFFLFCLFQAT